MSKLFSQLEIAKDFIQSGVQNTVSTVQKVHQQIADSSFAILPENAKNNPKVADFKNRQDEISNEVYKTILEVNQTLGELASDYFESMEDSSMANEQKKSS